MEQDQEKRPRRWLAEQWLWPVIKGLLAVAIVLAVGKRFYDDLHELDLNDLSLEPAWLVLSAILYIAGLGFSCLYWQRLLWYLGATPPITSTLRAYFIGHLGKYVPGKAWALLLRAALLKEAGVNVGVAGLTSLYEVLTMMAAAALLAAAIFYLQPPDIPGLDWSPVLTGLILLSIVTVPLWPGVFNFLLNKLAKGFESVAMMNLPKVRLGTLLEGLLLTSCGWLILGVGLWATLRGILPEAPDLTLSVWLHCVASLGLAYVAGFLAIVVPGGIGVREYFLLYLLAPLGPEAPRAAAILVLRLLGTAAELVVAAVLYWLSPRATPRQATPRWQKTIPPRPTSWRQGGTP